MRVKIFLLCVAVVCGLRAYSQNTSRKESVLREGWKFTHTDDAANSEVALDDSQWESVCVPHDWAIAGPFDRTIDMQVVAIEQNGEKVPTEKTGRSGSLPWIGTGWYRTTFCMDKGFTRAVLNFDGAMSEPVVYVNGKKAGEWKYGYSSFNVDVTDFVNLNGKENVLAVRLENVKESSRWYPGAGLYRPVTLIQTKDVCIAPWGVNVVTERVKADRAILDVSAKVYANGGEEYGDNLSGKVAVFEVTNKSQMSYNVRITAEARILSDGEANVRMEVPHAMLWSPENPNLYNIKVSVVDKARKNAVIDEKTSTFGIRTVSVTPEKGFCLNGVSRKIKGVCLHHDLGMIGTAVNRSALERQLKILKDMGCDAIRTSHNMPSQMQMQLCDSMGLMVMAESFDEWQQAKCRNGYHRFFNEWVERDLRNLVLANRLHPSVVMWSIGNEIPEQWKTSGAKQARRLTGIIHKYDPTRPVTAGCDNPDAAVKSGYLASVDIPGLNYRTHKYVSAYEGTPQGFILGSETASTVSSRGVYKFPVRQEKGKKYDDGQCSGYDQEACWWSNIPEDDWQLQDDQPWVIGEFVWTGFDYLGEPTPYDEYWPSRSSYFGIVDLAGLPKDRFYLYRSRWNTEDATIHLLPHWTWKGHEGDTIPVYCYSNYDEAELFVNGVSQGRIRKSNDSLYDRYRLRWKDVVYQPGEIKVVVFDKSGKKAGEKVVKTAGEPHHLELSAFDSSKPLKADGDNMVFVTVRIVDKDGNLCPDADNSLNVSVTGEGVFRGICNGDATSVEVFTKPQMKAFHGQLVVGASTTRKPGVMTISVKADGLESGRLNVTTSL